MPAFPTYTPNNPSLNQLPDSAFDPAFLAALQGGDGALETLVQRPHPGVLIFPLFTADFCQDLLREVSIFEHWCAHRKALPSRPNSMNNYGVVFEQLGLEELFDQLLSRLLPLTARWFPEHDGAHLDHHHAFLVEYGLEKDLDLDFHVDDSEVTLNACLGRTFEGGEVVFRGVRCPLHRQQPDREEERFLLEHTPGQAALHAGWNRHEVLPLRSGERSNLIAWFRSSQLRSRRAREAPTCGPWCAAA